MNIRLLVILLFLPLTSFTQQKWQKIHDIEGRFEWEMYGKVNARTDTLSSGDTLIIHSSLEAEVDDSEHPNVFYILSCSTYPANIIHSDSSLAKINLYLDAHAPKLQQEEGTEFLNSTVEFREGYPGKVFKYSLDEGKGKSQIVYRSFLIQNHLVQLGVISKPNQWHSLSTKRYFDSFRLKNIPPNNKDYGLSSNENRTFLINFPQKPQQQTRYLDSQIGQMAFQINVYERKVNQGNKVFIGTELKYPEGFSLEEEQLDNFYDESIEGSLANSNGSLIEKAYIDIAGHKGVAYQMSIYEGKMRGFYRTVYIDKRIYTFGVLTTKEKLDEEALDFLDSFELTE